MAYCIDEDAAGSKFARHTVSARFGSAELYVSDEPEFRVVGYFNELQLPSCTSISTRPVRKISSFAIRMSRA